MVMEVPIFDNFYKIDLYTKNEICMTITEDQV